MSNDFIKIPQATKRGYIELKVGGVADLSYPNSKTRRGRVQGNGEISPAITATETGVRRFEYGKDNKIRIRKLTPTEVFRLMGFCDEDVKKAMDVGISNTALYKLAGNSIITNCVELIAEHLYKAQYDESFICFDEVMNTN